MSADHPTGPLRFGHIELRPAQRQLLVGDKIVPLGARAFDVLFALTQRQGSVVAKTELLAAAWPGVVVEENNLQVQIVALRRVLGPDAIATVPGRGYQFTLALDEAPVTGSPQSPPAAERDRAGSPTNLPRQTTALIGRDEEVAQILDLLASHPLVTLTGIGGVGKTRLALEIGHLLLGDYPQGVWRIEFAPLNDPALVISAAATALGIDLGTAKRPLEALAQRLKGKRLLLILDNCEHLIDEAANLAHAILATEPGVRILATSQEALAIAGEQVFPVRGLATPPSGACVSLDDVSKIGALRLFRERARAVAPNFVLDGKSVVTCAAICRRLGGIPLAIEMAAARSSTLGLEELARSLDDRFRILTSGRRTDLPRHRTLRATLDWSYDLLPEGDRIVLRRLGVLAGRFTLDDASKLAASDASAESVVVDTVLSLAAKSLVAVDTGAGQARYSLLETTRAYSLEKLAEAGETSALQRRHALHFCDWFESSFAKEKTVAESTLRGRYEPVTDNLRAALDWAFDRDGEAKIGLALASWSGQTWARVGLWAEGIRRTEAAIALVDAETPAAIQARLWTSLGKLCRNAEPGRALTAHARAVALYRTLGESADLADALLQYAVMLLRCRRLDEARNALAEAQPLLERRPDPRSLAVRDYAMGALATEVGHVRESTRHMEASIDHCSRAGLDVFVYTVRVSAAYNMWILGDLAGAIAAYRDMAAQMRQPVFPGGWELAWALGNLSGVLADAGDIPAALDAAGEAMPTLVAEGSAWMFLDHFALRLGLAGQFDAAARLSGRAEAAFAKTEIAGVHMELRLREKLRALLREKMSADALARLIAEGAELPEDRCFQLALEP